MYTHFFREGFYRELKNLEAAECYSSLMRHLNLFPLRDGYFKECVTRLQSYQEDIRFVKDFNVSHPLTQVLQDKAYWRKEALLALRNKVAASSRSLQAQERQAGKELLKWIGFNFKKKLYQPSYTFHSNAVRNMMHDLTLRPHLRRAVETTGIQPQLDILVSLTAEIDETLDQRTRQESARVKKAALIRSEIYQQLKYLFRILEVEMAMGKESNYVQLGHELKKVLEYYRTPYVARTTRYKNAAQKQEEDAPLVAAQPKKEPATKPREKSTTATKPRSHTPSSSPQERQAPLPSNEQQAEPQPAGLPATSQLATPPKESHHKPHRHYQPVHGRRQQRAKLKKLVAEAQRNRAKAV